MNYIKLVAVLSVILCCLSVPTRAKENDGKSQGYFLSLQQKKDLVWKGEMTDSQGTLYSVWIVPGYKRPLKMVEPNVKEAGQILKEYLDPQKYNQIWDQSRNVIKGTLKTSRRILRKSMKSWRRNFNDAQRLVDKRVFGWWLAYPWAFLASTVETIYGFAKGAVATTSGVTYSAIGVPIYHLSLPAMQAAWFGGVKGIVAPVSAMTWNTAIAPPLALFGQKPSMKRVDGFWIRVLKHSNNRSARVVKHSDNWSAHSFSNIIQWGKFLHKELDTYRVQRQSIDQEYHKASQLLNKERQLLNKERSSKLNLINKAQKEHAEKSQSNIPFAIMPDQITKLESYRRLRLQQEAVIRKTLRDEGLSDLHINRILQLLKQYPLPNSK